jgi:hypothetical protein
MTDPKDFGDVDEEHANDGLPPTGGVHGPLTREEAAELGVPFVDEDEPEPPGVAPTRDCKRPYPRRRRHSS